MIWLLACAALGLGLAWWSRPMWLLWFEQPRPTPHERRRQRLRNATDNARETLLAGYARDALWWARRARRIDPDDPEALAVMASVLAHKGRYEASARHHRLALHRAQASGLAAVHVESWCHEALEYATTLLILADEDLPRRDAYRSEAHDWLQYALENDSDCRADLNPRLQKLASNEWVMP